MRKIRIADMTLTENSSMLSFKEKIEIARHLDNLNTDIIYMPEIVNVKTDVLLVRTISAFVRNSTICVSGGMTEESIETACLALSAAKKARLRICLPVSVVQMEYICHKKMPKMLELAKTLFTYACEKCENVEFVAIDATRADREFLAKIIKLAIDCNIRTVTISDDEGTMLPDELSVFINTLKEDVSELSKVDFGIICKDTIGVAVAGAITAVKNGVNEVKCCVGKGKVTDLDTFAGIINSCGNRCDVCSDIKYSELHRITKQIEWISAAANNEQSDKRGFSYASNEENISLLDMSASPDDVNSAVKKLGYDLSDEDEKKVYDEFKKVAEKKKVGLRELDAIVASVALEISSTYNLVSYVINNGNIISSSAQIKLEREGEETQGVCIGDGPVDASFRALEQIIGRHFELDDFQIQSITEGREAVGSALVKLRSGGKFYSGNGISTDIIEASIRAYLSAVNKIVYEEVQK